MFIVYCFWWHWAHCCPLIVCETVAHSSATSEHFAFFWSHSLTGHTTGNNDVHPTTTTPFICHLNLAPLWPQCNVNTGHERQLCCPSERTSKSLPALLTHGLLSMCVYTFHILHSFWDWPTIPRFQWPQHWQLHHLTATNLGSPLDSRHHLIRLCSFSPHSHWLTLCRFHLWQPNCNQGGQHIHVPLLPHQFFPSPNTTTFVVPSETFPCVATCQHIVSLLHLESLVLLLLSLLTLVVRTSSWSTVALKNAVTARGIESLHICQS